MYHKQEETKLQRQIQAYLKSLGAYEFKVHGEIFMRAGIPDIICCYKGKFIGSIFKDIQGRAIGWAHVGGTLHNIDLTGNLKVDAQVKAPMLNTVYNL